MSYPPMRAAAAAAAAAALVFEDDDEEFEAFDDATVAVLFVLCRDVTAFMETGEVSAAPPTFREDVLPGAMVATSRLP